MKIKKGIYEQLLNLPNVPPETGGILGGNDVINRWVLDEIERYPNEGTYEPNVKFLNSIIHEWILNGVDFMGIFHTHSMQWEALSNTDKDYIFCIMKSMPETIEKLYFPLVFPLHSIKGYCAIKKNGQIHINEEVVEII